MNGVNTKYNRASHSQRTQQIFVNIGFPVSFNETLSEQKETTEKQK